MRPGGKRPIGKISPPPAGKNAGSASKIYVMKVVYVDEDGKELEQPPPCWYVMQASVPPKVLKVLGDLTAAETYAQVARDRLGI